MGCVLGCNKLGISAARIAQAAEVRIRVRSKSNKTAMQIDGEPWLQPNATVSFAPTSTLLLSIWHHQRRNARTQPPMTPV
mmetsp:Transcript_63205/g.173688  ORF Transcript_63205/g.173688 Transcript_63205/m.173688 type:complete len:80 (-) Transcript_63205:153-392(-)